MLTTPNTPDPGAGRKWPRRIGRWLRNLVLGAGVLSVSLFLLCVLLIEANMVRGNYPPVLRDLGWALGEQEHVYNFGSVVPGKIFRSGEPDARFLEYAKRHYGIRHIVTLNGDPPDDDPAVRDMDITIETHDWDKDDLPTREEFQQIVYGLDDKAPVLVHCTSGKDRTGYLMAGYRFLQQGWPMQEALDEMLEYGHNPEQYQSVLDYFLKVLSLKVSDAGD